jgi:hypothetical protein
MVRFAVRMRSITRPPNFSETFSMTLAIVLSLQILRDLVLIGFTRVMARVQSIITPCLPRFSIWSGVVSAEMPNISHASFTTWA